MTTTKLGSALLKGIFTMTLVAATFLSVNAQKDTTKMAKKEHSKMTKMDKKKGDKMGKMDKMHDKKMSKKDSVIKK